MLSEDRSPCNELYSYIHLVVAEDQKLSIDELHEQRIFKGK